MAYQPAGLNGLISTANSTVANLAGAGVFTGTAEDVTDFSSIKVSVFSSHASATDGFSMQQSTDGTNWDNMDAYTIPAATGKTFHVSANAKFFRVVYINGATLTTSLRIQTFFSKVEKRGSSFRPQDSRTNDNDFEEVASYLQGFNGTSWDRLRSTIANGLAVDVTRLSPLPNTTVVNRSGTITTGGTAQVLAAANTARTGLTIQNTHASADLWLTEDGTTTAALNVGYKLPAGASAKINTQKSISIWGGTTGQPFAATEF